MRKTLITITSIICSLFIVLVLCGIIGLTINPNKVDALNEPNLIIKKTMSYFGIVFFVGKLIRQSIVTWIFKKMEYDFGGYSKNALKCKYFNVLSWFVKKMHKSN